MSENLKYEIIGVLTRAGALSIHGEADTGLVISMSEEALKAVKHLPMYRRVAVVVLEDHP